jgi:hypothetical protein
MANIPAVAGNFQSNIVSAFDVVKPEILSKMFKRYNDQGLSWFLTLNQLGFLKPVSNQIYSHYEDDLKNPTFLSRGIVAQPAAGASMDVILAAVNVDTNNGFYPRLGDMVYFKGGQTGIITAIDVTTPAQPELTISPVSATYQLPALAANEEVSIFSGAFSEGSGQPKGVVPGAIKRTNYTQIIKETMGVTGSQLTTQTWFDGWVPAGGIEGATQTASGDSWYNINFADAEFRMALKTSGALLFGEAGDASLIDPLTGEPIYTTQGLIPEIKRIGMQESYTPGSTSLADVDTYNRLLDTQYAGDFVMGLFSRAYTTEFENALSAFLANTNINYVESQMEAKYGRQGKSICTDFNSVKRGARTFMYQTFMEFSNRQTFGIAGSVAQTYGVFVPMVTKKDPKSLQLTDNIGARYKEKNGYSRKMEIWSVNGAGPGLKVTDLDMNFTYMRSEIGAHQMGVNQMLLVSA